MDGIGRGAFGLCCMFVALMVMAVFQVADWLTPDQHLPPLPPVLYAGEGSFEPVPTAEIELAVERRRADFLESVLRIPKCQACGQRYRCPHCDAAEFVPRLEVNLE